MRRYEPVPTRINQVIVMAGLVPAIHVFGWFSKKAWMPGTRPGMTTYGVWSQINPPDRPLSQGRQ